jgi:hypothetical protein
MPPRHLHTPAMRRHLHVRCAIGLIPARHSFVEANPFLLLLRSPLLASPFTAATPRAPSSCRLRKMHPAVGRMSLATSGPASTSSRTTPSPYSSPTTSSAPAISSRGPHRRRPPLDDLPPWSSSCGESLPFLCLKWIHPPLDPLYGRFPRLPAPPVHRIDGAPPPSRHGTGSAPHSLFSPWATSPTGSWADQFRPMVNRKIYSFPRNFSLNQFKVQTLKFK